MDVAKIKAVLLASVGNPESGAISDNANAMALAVLKELNGESETVEIKEFNPVKETRIKKISETR